MLVKKINYTNLEKNTYEKIIELIFKYSVLDGNVQPYMYFPYSIMLKILNNNLSLNENSIVDILYNIPDKYFPYVDPIDREISIGLKNLSEAKEEAHKKIIFYNYNPFLFLRTFPLILISPTNKDKKLEEQTFYIINLTHNENIAKLMVYYNLINVEYLNNLTFIEHLKAYFSNQNLKLKYLLNNEDEKNISEFTNEIILYKLLDYSYYILQEINIPNSNNIYIDLIYSLSMSLFNENFKINENNIFYNKNFNSDEKRILKILKKKIKM